MTPPIILLLAVLLDRVLGEVQRWHPLVGFGRLADRLEVFFHPGANANETVLITRVRGALAVVLLIAPLMLVAALISDHTPFGKIFDLALVYISIGSTSLRQHAVAVAEALEQENLPEARLRVGKIVSRDTASLQKDDIVRATIESVLENGNDAIFGPVIWYMVMGAPGVVLYRLANTLDAMWGYRNERYLQFGWAAAKLDDILNWIPARLTAGTYTILGKRGSAWDCWQSQGSLWYSPNAGPVMAAGAGALEVKLGGPAIYHGTPKLRPELGTGKDPEIPDIKSSLNLIENGILLWVAFFVIEGFFSA
jgi:adenosylcobinamide-phosphate synthase